MKNTLQNFLTTLAKGKIDFANQNYNRLEATNKQFTNKNLYYPPQFHNYVEIIFALEGKLNVLIGQRWFVYKPSKIIAILPGVTHSERYYTSNSSYQLLWIIIAPTSAHSHITSYNRKKGYHIVTRSSLTSDKSTREYLHQLATEISTHIKKLPRIKFQTLLMQLICNSIDNMDNHSSQNTPITEQVINQIKFYIDSHYNEPITLSKLASMVHYNPCYLNTLFKKYTGIPINRYLTEVRLSKAEELLSQANLEIKQIAYRVGFRDPLYFSRIFSRHRGLPPSKFRSRI